jgi:hypothetical protein
VLSPAAPTPPAPAPSPVAPSAAVPARSPVASPAAAPARSPVASPAAAPARSAPTWMARRGGCSSSVPWRPLYPCGGLRGSLPACVSAASPGAAGGCRLSVPCRPSAPTSAPRPPQPELPALSAPPGDSSASAELEEALMGWLEDGHDLTHAQQGEVVRMVQSQHPASWRDALRSSQRVPLVLQQHMLRLARVVLQREASLPLLPVSAPAQAPPPPPVAQRFVTREVTMCDAVPAVSATATPAPLLQPPRQRRGACAAAPGSGDVAMADAPAQAAQPDMAMPDAAPSPLPLLSAHGHPEPAVPAPRLQVPASRSARPMQLMPPAPQPLQQPLRAPPALPGPSTAPPAPAPPSPVVRTRARTAAGAAVALAAQQQRTQRRHRRPDGPCLAPGASVLPPPPPLPPPPALPGPPRAPPVRASERGRAPPAPSSPAAPDSGSERALQPSSPVRHRRAGDTASRRNPPRQRSHSVPWYSCTGRPSSGSPAPP